MEPSHKEPEMEAAITALFGVDRRTAIRNDTCVFCGKPAVKFNDELSRREFSISGLCQACQDDLFHDDDEE